MTHAQRVRKSLAEHQEELDAAVRFGTMRIAGRDHNGHPTYEVTDRGRELIAEAALAYCARTVHCAASVHHRNCLRELAPRSEWTWRQVDYAGLQAGDLIFQRDGKPTPAPYRVRSHEVFHIEATRLGPINDRRVQLAQGERFDVLRKINNQEGNQGEQDR